MGTTTIYGLRYPAPSDPPDVPTDMQELAIDVEAGLKAPFKSYATTLPATPIDGQIAVLVDSLTNPSYQWTFRYNAASTSAYKWEFVGGSAFCVESAADQLVNVLGWWGSGVAITVPRAGEYQLGYGYRLTHSAAAQIFGGIKIGAADPGDPTVAAVAITAGWYQSTAKHGIHVTITSAGTVVELAFNANPVGLTTANRYLLLTPTRVS